MQGNELEEYEETHEHGEDEQIALEADNIFNLLTRRSNPNMEGNLHKDLENYNKDDRDKEKNVNHIHEQVDTTGLL